MKHRTRSGRSAPVVAAAVVLGLITSGALVWQASSAAFTASTSNGVNTFNAGSVGLSTSLGGTAIFTPPPTLVPGSTDAECIDVIYDGDVAATVTMYSSDPSGNLGQYLNMKIEMGPDGKACADVNGWTSVYDNDLEAFYTAYNAVAPTNPTEAPTGWTTLAADETKVFRFTYTLENNNSAQGQTTSVTYNWRASAGS